MEYIQKRGNPPKINIIAWFFALVIMFLMIVFGLPFALDQYEKEQQWRAERLCAQGYYCNPKRGA